MLHARPTSTTRCLHQAPHAAAACGADAALLTRVGLGKAFASFGEIAQGRRADGEDFLVTLPVDLWSRCRVVREPVTGASRVRAPLPKSGQVAKAMLRAVGAQAGIGLRIGLWRDMPVGKGLSSSTADMLAVLRACEAAFDVTASESYIGRLFATIEPHDALHYPACVAYNHRAGRLLAHFGHVPDFRIIGVDAGGAVCTRAYNRRLTFSPSRVAQDQALYERVLAAFSARDDAAVARCALAATELQLTRTGSPFLRRLLALAQQPSVLGIVTAHSGTCAGLLLPGSADAATLAGVEAHAARLGTLFRTRTLRSR